MVSFDTAKSGLMETWSSSDIALTTLKADLSLVCSSLLGYVKLSLERGEFAKIFERFLDFLVKKLVDLMVYSMILAFITYLL